MKITSPKAPAPPEPCWASTFSDISIKRKRKNMVLYLTAEKILS